MSEIPTTRHTEDGFDGRYPNPSADWAEDLYRRNGMEPPWTLNWNDGVVVPDGAGGIQDWMKARHPKR